MQNKLTYFISSFIVIISAAIYLTSCGSDDKVINNSNPPEPVDTSSFEYPFGIGSTWTYSKIYSVENIRPDSIRYLFNSYPITGTGYMEILYDTNIVIGGTVRVIYDRLTQGNDTLASRFYYTNSSNSMVCYGYRGGNTPAFPYDKNPKIKFGSGGELFNSLSELSYFLSGEHSELTSSNDTFITESPVVVVLKYPVVKGTEWIFKDFGTSTLKKKYISFENYHLDTATISCIKTQRINSGNSDYVLYDYYSKYGQMKRDFLFKNTQVRNQFGITIGYADYREAYGVNSFNIVSK